jgi:hypothetical protein
MVRKMKKVFQIELEVPAGFEGIEPQVSRMSAFGDCVAWSLVARLPDAREWIPATELHVGKQVRARDYDYDKWATGKLVHVEEAEYRYLLVVPGEFASLGEWFKVCEVPNES